LKSIVRVVVLCLSEIGRRWCEEREGKKESDERERERRRRLSVAVSQIEAGTKRMNRRERMEQQQSILGLSRM
jgi:hypothetical protein